MRAFIYLAAAAFAGLTAASSTANAFKNPQGGYSFTAGEATTLQWSPSTPGTVSLRLQWGDVSTPTSGTAIASDINNSGSYTWTVPTNLVANQEYTIEIIDDSDSNNYNFLPRFTVTGATGSASSTEAGSTSTADSGSSPSSSTVTPSPSTTSSTSTSSSTTSTDSSTSAPTTFTTATSTSSSSDTSAAAATSTPTSTSTSTSTSATSSGSATASESAVPTTNAGMVNRVSGGMLAVVAAAIALM